jgi:hypothetical protein
MIRGPKLERIDKDRSEFKRPDIDWNELKEKASVHREKLKKFKLDSSDDDESK